MHTLTVNRLAVWAGILILATFLIALSLTPAVQEQIMRTQARNCGVAGFIAFVGLALVARVCQRMSDAREDQARTRP